MNINDLTISQASEVARMFSHTTITAPRLHGRKLVQAIGRLVFVADVKFDGEFYHLTNVRNIRYWSRRPNGLGDVASNGPTDGDRIDTWPDTMLKAHQLLTLTNVGDKW